MTQAVEPKPEFRSLSGEAIITALQDPDPMNPIAVEVVRLINGYEDNFHAQVPRRGRIPPDIWGVKPRWPIEAIAMRLSREVIRETLLRPRRREKT